MGIFQAESVPRGALYLPKVHALISKQFLEQILIVLGLQICVFHDLIMDIYCYNLRESKCLNGPDSAAARLVAAMA